MRSTPNFDTTTAYLFSVKSFASLSLCVVTISSEKYIKVTSCGWRGGKRVARRPSVRQVNPRPAGGGRICPLLDFLNNSKTVADIDTLFLFGVPYLVYLILHQFDIEWPNFVEIGQKIFEKLTCLWGHFTPILTKIGSMLRNSQK